MKPADARRKGRTVTHTSEKTQVDTKQAAIFFGVVAGLIIVVAITAYFISSMGDDSQGENRPVSLNCYNPEHGITPNGTAQFVLVLKNNENDKNVVRLTITDSPENWSIHLDQQMAILQKKESRLSILSVSAPEGVTTGSFTISIRAESLSFNGRASDVKVTLAPHPQTSNRTVQTGDHISVNYVGYLKDGTIFDTSVESVAKNKNAPKTDGFEVRESYSTLDFEANNGQMIEGFDEGVLGMQVGETKVIVVPPDKGYTQEGHELYGKTLYFEVTLEKIG